MARGKKKESALTPEEKLAQALVSEDEQPYKVPGNWCWVRLGSLGYTNIGLTYKPADISPTGTIVLRSSNIQNGQIDYSDIVSVEMDIPENKMSKKGDILICARNGSKALVGKTAIIDRDGMSYGAFMAIFRSPYNSLIYHYLNSHYFRDIIDHDVGTTTINQITQSLIKELPFPLPPFAEQQRIVDRIEYLFAKLDEAKEKAQSVVDSFETRKAAILHKAFTGELTAKWRAEHGMKLTQWERKPLSKVSNNHDSRRIPLSQAERSNLERIYDYYGASGVIDKVDRFLFEGRHLLIGEDGANLVTRSKPIAFIADGQYWVNNHAHVLSTTSEMILDFLCYYINSIDLVPYVTGSAQPKMTQAKMNGIPIPVPSVLEQSEIVRILDSLFAKEQQAKEAAEAVLEKVDLQKKSILARAFRGELGTNDPTEESAMELLMKNL